MAKKKAPAAEVQTPAGAPVAPPPAPAVPPAAPAAAPVVPPAPPAAPAAPAVPAAKGKKTKSAAAPAAAPAAPAAPKVVLVKQNGINRPRPGCKTSMIWEIADEISAKLQKPAPRKDVIDAAMAKGSNPATATTQYGLWRKFNGLVGSDEPKAPEATA